MNMEEMASKFKQLREVGLESQAGRDMFHTMAEEVSHHVRRIEKYEDLEAYFVAMVALDDKDMHTQLNGALAVRIGFQLALLRIATCRAGLPDEQTKAAIDGINGIIDALIKTRA
jgi:hypothetical protein